MTRSQAQDQIAAIFGPMEGREIPGGCDRCEAYQTVDPISAGVWQLTVHHDDECPVLRAHDERSGR